MVEFKGIEKFEVVSEEKLQACQGGGGVAPVLGVTNFWEWLFGKNSGKK
ncbi:hypothetical protein [Pseudolactococcus reticulitermitis]|uniref:Uncharacterized protein n=1 Tax=Pseudolactococcus reticulitermitis TaxID=2025039 RepID=A0A224X8S4_9LACT|nr:hypothetical protein [Lactococcus reticulitermitis]GAX47680.1 hypothetical protein RsY01_1281 [Lactococcus reticulitermitis]